MTWTFTDAPDDTTERGRIDAVRILVGDTDTNDQQVSDESIIFALSQKSNDIYRSAAWACRAIAGKYSREVTTRVEGVSSNLSDLAKQYSELASKLEREAVRSGGLGLPVAGGISIDEMDAADDDSDRVEPYYVKDQFNVLNRRIEDEQKD